MKRIIFTLALTSSLAACMPKQIAGVAIALQTREKTISCASEVLEDWEWEECAEFGAYTKEGN